MPKNTRLYIVLVFVFVCFTNQEAQGFTLFQNPEHIKQFDKDFKDRYSGSTYNYKGKNIKSTPIGGSGNYDDYTDKTPTIDNDNNGFSFDLGSSGIFLKWFFYLVLGIAIIVLAYMLLNNGSHGFFTSKRNKSLSENTEITAENIENTNIKSLIESAENNKDFRLAIRYYFLLVLKNLSLKNYISLEDDKTNTEYLSELENKPFQNAFNYNLYLYNYIWYGNFPLSAEQYGKAKQHFTTLLNRI